MIKDIQRVLNSLGEALVVDGIPGPKTKAAIFRHPIAQEWEKTSFEDERWLAYCFATALHETAHTLQPVTEYGSKEYLHAKKYWPYIGRGYVQLTWKSNYEKYGIQDTPEKALEPELAAHIMIDGMTKGIFTGRKLSQYFNEAQDDPINARRIVNSLDQAEKNCRLLH
jgi:hypothetical protein